MPKLNPISRRELIRKLKRLGFDGPYSGTRHQYMEKGSHCVFIPNPHGKDIAPPLLNRIIEQIGITTEEFINT
jgi:predicted RNA binding protein YcfA (HicA-like mRNA interferase family)